MSTLLKLVSIWTVLWVLVYAVTAKAADQPAARETAEQCTYIDIIEGDDDTATCLAEAQLERRHQLVSCPAAWRYVVRTDRVYYVITGHLWQVPKTFKEYVMDQLTLCKQAASR